MNKYAEKFISIHPWSQMVRFAKTGIEVCAIAIRIARAALGKDKYYFAAIMDGMIGIYSLIKGPIKHLIFERLTD